MVAEILAGIALAKSAVSGIKGAINSRILILFSSWNLWPNLILPSEIE